MRTLLILLTLAMPVSAESLCGRSDIPDLLSGVWERAPKISLENETLSMLRQAEPEVAVIAAGTVDTPFLSSLTGGPVALRPTERIVYDVDAVDEMLDLSENAELADILSDTPCGPEDLPQLVARIPETAGISAAGTVTLIAYFDDRLLEITELELRSEAALIFMTATALWVPRAE